MLDPLRRLNSSNNSSNSSSNEATTDPAHAFDASVLRPHFALQRPRLLAQLARWRDEASEANRAKFARVLTDIAAEIDKLEANENL
jgi:putative hemolysin